MHSTSAKKRRIRLASSPAALVRDLQSRAGTGRPFITGEAPHWAAVAAEELGLNLLLGGHYASETFGVKALAAHLSKRFKIPWTFIDCPTGM
jgi:putative NIF3 family GTP cyclohydrolase 1 type 2